MENKSHCLSPLCIRFGIGTILFLLLAFLWHRRVCNAVHDGLQQHDAYCGVVFLVCLDCEIQWMPFEILAFCTNSARFHIQFRRRKIRISSAACIFLSHSVALCWENFSGQSFNNLHAGVKSCHDRHVRLQTQSWAQLQQFVVHPSTCDAPVSASRMHLRSFTFAGVCALAVSGLSLPSNSWLSSSICIPLEF